MAARLAYHPPMAETCTLKVERSLRKEVRAMLTQRVRLKFQEKNGWFSATFTVTGPASALAAVLAEIEKRREQIHEDLQW